MERMVRRAARPGMERLRPLLEAAAGDRPGGGPLNEAALASLDSDSALHLVAEEAGDVVGYLQHDGRFGTAQLVVHPARRRRGVASALLREAAREVGEEVAVWAFGDSPAAQALAVKTGRAAQRELLVMESAPSASSAMTGPAHGRDAAATSAGGSGSMTASARGRDRRDGATRPSPPAGQRPAARDRPAPLSQPPTATAKSNGRARRLAIRGFRPGDADEFLRVNALAFADHPEQGRFGADDLAERMAQPWFDADGLLLGFDDEGLAGFHWTKLAASGGDLPRGEVYVLGVHPRAQGRGYGRELLQAGLDHLARRGAASVFLYVDGRDGKAVRLYSSGGFSPLWRDVLYAPRPKEAP
ncbi:MAG: GNAT family N-acetyltransferase [Propionibacteriaceae bacterium]|nr:GNAT family N-acetyltransferase [Propionibacteriaceae bacterium]